MCATVLTTLTVHVHEIPHFKRCGPAPISVEVRSSFEVRSTAFSFVRSCPVSLLFSYVQKMVFSDYVKQRILFFKQQGLTPTAASRLLKEEGFSSECDGYLQFPSQI